MSAQQANVSITGKVRQPWLDYVRLASIFLVILYHTPPRVPLVDDAVVLNLRVPVFFLVSGFLYSDRWRSFGAYLKHRSKQILVPYTTFFILFYALWLCPGTHTAPDGHAIAWWVPLQEWAWGYPREVCGPFWYIACLFTMQMLFYWMQRFIGRRWLLPVCLAISLGYMFVAWLVDTDLYMSFWNFTHAIQYLPFYAMGNCLKQPIERLRFTSVQQGLLLTVLAVASVVIMALSLPTPGHQEWTYGMAKVLAGAMIIPLYLCIGKWVAGRLGRKTVVELVVVNGTVYLAMQNYFIGFIRNVIIHFWGHEAISQMFWWRPAIALVVMVAILPFAWLIHYHAPWMLGKGRLFEKETH